MKISKLTLIIALTMLASLGGYAQKSMFIKLGVPDALGWTVVVDKMTGKKFGYIDSLENLVIPLVYEKAEKFEGNLARVQKNKKWGLINREEKEICPIVYDYIENFNAVAPNFARVECNGKYGIIDTQGKEIIPMLYEAILFNEGLAPLKGNGKVGFIDERCDLVIPAIYDDCGYFSHGSAAVKLNGLWGYIDSEGKTLIPFNLDYEKCGIFSDGLIAVFQNKKWGYIDATGKEIIPIKLNYNEVYGFSDGMARIRKGNKFGYIDRLGKVVISPKYVGAEDFRYGVAIVADKNSTGKMIEIGTMMAQSAEAATSYVAAQTAQTAEATLIRATGGTVDNYKWSQNQMTIQQNFNNDMQRANRDFQKNMQSSGGGVVFQLGMIDKKGKQLMPFKYGILDLDFISGNWYLLSKCRMYYTGEMDVDWGGHPLIRYGIYDVEKKQEIINADYSRFDMVTFADKKWIVVAVSPPVVWLNKLKHLYGIIDYSGEVIIKTEHEIFEPTLFAPHERILVGDILKKKKDFFGVNFYQGLAILEATYGIIDYSGKIIIPKMVCESIELIDNTFVATLKTGEKKYFDLNGQEIIR